jgi:hypothetical protein
VQAGGNVVRLVGLYHAHRGAHTFFLKQGTVARPGDNIVNLLHYEDAASLAVAVLDGAGRGGTGAYRGQVFIGCDNHPITFRVGSMQGWLQKLRNLMFYRVFHVSICFLHCKSVLAQEWFLHYRT